MPRYFAVAAVLICGTLSAADPELTPLHPPRPLPPAYESMEFVRENRWDRWQYVAVDRSGHFRARVVLDEPEPYYLVNGRPYPLLSIRPRDYIPHILD